MGPATLVLSQPHLRKKLPCSLASPAFCRWEGSAGFMTTLSQAAQRIKWSNLQMVLEWGLAPSPAWCFYDKLFKNKWMNQKWGGPMLLNKAQSR